MATRAPSRSNSCAAASPIPLLPPVMRIFLPASLPIVVAPTRFAESLLNGVVRSVEDWPKPSFHRAGHHASLMHLAAHRNNSDLAFNRLVDLIIELSTRNACSCAPMRYGAVTPLRCD